jgi:hypothetical protein
MISAAGCILLVDAGDSEDAVAPAKERIGPTKSWAGSAWIAREIIFGCELEELELLAQFEGRNFAYFEMEQQPDES